MSKKIFSFILSLAVIFSCVPTNVFAAEKAEETAVVATSDADSGVDTQSVSTQTNGFTYSPGDSTTFTITKTMTKVRYCGVATSDCAVNIMIKTTDGSKWRSFSFACTGEWYTLDRSVNPIPPGTYNIIVEYQTHPNYTLFVNFS